jgi:SAM-dependent methyltransferase
MLRSTRQTVPPAHLVIGDIEVLPLADASVDLSLAMHLLYHAPDPRIAVQELRRITRLEGQVIVVLNGDDHLLELREIVATVLSEQTASVPAPVYRVRLDEGEQLLKSEFASVERSDFIGNLVVPVSEPIERYIQSTGIMKRSENSDMLLESVMQRVRAHIRQHDVFRVTTHSGCLICV